MIKVQKAPISFVYNPQGINNFLVCYAPGDDMIEVFRRAYVALKCNLESKKVKKC